MAMTGPLEQWQERLERHFFTLAESRAVSESPIFALEHDLSSAELEQVSHILRSRQRSNLPLDRYWLLWVIYATEHGYGYEGEEYWLSFEEETPVWDFHHREGIKAFFKRFQQVYHGVVPSGAWASHFRIIAWPITHAVLPRYLQQQFARVLYDLRFRLASVTTLDARTVGRLLAANAQHVSSRFQQFLQQEELAGRIVLSILHAEPFKGPELIYPPTLRRIVSDVEKVSSSRERLKETQRVVCDRFTGIGRGTGTLVGRPRVAGVPPDAACIFISPKVLLRHTGGGTWSVLLEVPSFRSVATLSADAQSFLQRTRCRLNGADDMKPAGWLLSGNRKGALRRWPDPAKPLILFERPHPWLDRFLDSGARLSPGPMWLFLIASDGTAREITGRAVRPGHAYIVVTTREVPEARPDTTSCKLDCDNVKSFRITLPANVSAEMAARLGKIGLQVARTIRVWPAGLPGRGWDGEGNSEWLTTEAPCFGINHDYPVEGYKISLDRGAETFIGTTGCRPVFVRLSPLSAGEHFMQISARWAPSLDALAPSAPAQGFVQLMVREPEPWTPATAGHPGLIVTVDPDDADLDALWSNKVDLAVAGPDGYAVRITVKLESADGREVFSEQVGAPMRLPVTPDTWRCRFAQFLRTEDHAWSYLEAARGALAIDGEVLGSCALQFEHHVRPLRWVLRRDHSNITVRLVDDSGQDGTTLKVNFYSMQHPLKAVPVPSRLALTGVAAVPPGGLFLASHPAETDAVAVSTGLAGEGLQGLSVKPEFDELFTGTVKIAEALRILTLWHAARQSGFLVSVRHQQVVDGLLKAMVVALCGRDWAGAEERFRGSRSVEALEFLKRQVTTPPNFARVLLQEHSRMESNAAEGARWFAELAARYGLCKDQEFCEFALRFVSQPHSLPAVCGARLDHLLAQAAKTPVILRAARLLALLTVSHNGGADPSWLPTWKWSSPG
jgi:hypothetical protein